jgi:hypothetical protein
MDITPKINQYNVQNTRNMINAKKGSTPYYANGLTAVGSITDFDHFPYTRFWRGIPNSSNPVVMEREAGWRPREDQCYETTTSTEQPMYANNCFESACSVVYPCQPKFLQRFTDKEALDIQLNRNCVVQYR